MPGCGVGPHTDDIQSVCLLGVRCHSLLTSLTCRMYLTGSYEQQKVGWGGTVCFCSTAGRPWFDRVSGGLTNTKCILPCPSPTHCLPLAWSCVFMKRSLLIRPNLCCLETHGCIQHRPISFKHHPSVSWILLALKKDPGSLKCGQAPEPLKVYPMPRVQQGS